MSDDKLSSFVLSNVEGIGPAIFLSLIEKFGTAEAVFGASFSDIMASETVNAQLAQKILLSKNWDNEKEKFDQALPEGSLFVTLTEQNYPAKLKTIANPPPYLYIKGHLDLFEAPSLAIVGSRRPSDYGLRLASRLASDLAGAGVIIISGLAYGIDGAAHQAALEAGGKTIAVFGCGLDIVYPNGHRGLADRIVKSGCLISEFPKGAKPEKFNFPIRNRIVSGLSDGILVVEAGVKSGALVTASLGLDQGRDILAVPGRVDSELSAGPNGLIKQGAIAITSADDIFNNFGWHQSSIAKEPEFDLNKLSRDELTIFKELSVQPVHIDEIGRKTNLGPGKTAEALLNLELKGFVMRKPGNFVVRA
jgi:DNA processing protein